MRSSLLKSKVQPASQKTSAKAAAAAKAAGGSAGEISQIKRDAKNALELDARSILHHQKHEAEQLAVAAATQAHAALAAKDALLRKADKSVAKEQLNNAIKKMVKGEASSASASLNAASAAMNSKGKTKGNVAAKARGKVIKKVTGNTHTSDESDTSREADTKGKGNVIDDDLKKGQQDVAKEEAAVAQQAADVAKEAEKVDSTTGPAKAKVAAIDEVKSGGKTIFDELQDDVVPMEDLVQTVPPKKKASPSVLDEVAAAGKKLIDNIELEGETTLDEILGWGK
jgi:hypothetical protein